jgi:uncharacterized protein YjiS (DUF1127 family)
MTMQTLPLPTTTALARISGLAGKAARPLVALVRAYKNRRDMAILASFDDRMLQDVGLTRGDLRDAVAEPLWRDPTSVLVKRARERRFAGSGFRGALYGWVKRPRDGSAKLAGAPPLAPAGDYESSRLFPARSRYY